MPDPFLYPPLEEYDEVVRYRIVPRIDKDLGRVVYQPQAWVWEFPWGRHAKMIEYWEEVGKAALTVEDARYMCEIHANPDRPIAEFTIKKKRMPTDA